MPGTLTQILPLAIATGLSTGLFLFLVMILMKGKRQAADSLSFVAGVTLALVAVAAIMMFIAKPHDVTVHHPKSLSHAILDLALGATAIVLLIKTFMVRGEKKEKEKSGSRMDSWGPVQFFLAGFGMRLLSLDTMPPFISAVGKISIAHISGPEKMDLLVGSVIIGILPVLLPVLLFIISPVRAMAVLVPVKGFIERHKQVILRAILTLLGAYLAYSGIKALLILRGM